MNEQSLMRHEFKIVPENPVGYMAYRSFSAKVTIPVWRKVQEKGGTVHGIHLEEDWMPSSIRGVSPVDVVQMIERMLSGYVRAGIYRKAKKR